jgi:hypothetical protein
MGGPDTVIDTSAMFVTTDVVTLDPGKVPLLLFVFGSGVAEVLNAMFVKLPLAGAVIDTVKLVVAPFVKIMAGHTTRLPLKLPPPEAPWYMTFKGKLSCTTTFTAIEGPLLVAVIV